MLKVVEYTSPKWLECAGQGSVSVIICLDKSVLRQPAPNISRSFIEGTLISTLSYCSMTGVREYRYGLQYDTTFLKVPETPLHCSEVKGVLCKGCLTTYIEETAAFILLQINPLVEKA